MLYIEFPTRGRPRYFERSITLKSLAVLECVGIDFKNHFFENLKFSSWNIFSDMNIALFKIMLPFNKHNISIHDKFLQDSNTSEELVRQFL